MPFELSCMGALNALQVECIGPLNSEIKEKLKFPNNIGDIHICKELNDCYIIRSSVKTLQEIDEFLKKWTDESRVVWRVNKTCPKRNSAGLKNIYWKEFRCQSSNVKVSKNTKKAHKKHTNCPAYMSVTVKKITSRCRSRDTHLPKYPTIIKINNNHNHQITHPDYLKNCPVSQETKIKFLRMYQKGHTPLSALKLHRTDLRREYDDSIALTEMDRSICPDNQWCYRLYASFLANKEKVPEEESITEESPDSPESIIIGENVIEYSEPEMIKCDSYYYDTIEVSNIECDDDNIHNLPIKTEYLSDDPVTSVEQVDDFTCENFIDSSTLSDNQIKNYLAPFMNLMRRKLKSAPELFVPTMEAFNNRLKFFETDLDLSEALYRFGK